MSSPTSEYLNKHTLRRVQVLDCIIHRREKYSSTISKNSDLDVSGYVYAATNDLFPSLVKIGCTLNEDPIIRLNFIATKIELSSSFKIIAIIKTKDPYKLKAQMHGYFHIYKYPGENGIEFFEVPIISVQRYFSDYIRDRNSKNDKGVKTQNLIVKQNYFQHNDGDMRIDNSNNIPIIKSIVDDWIDSIIEDAVVKFSVDKVIPIKNKPPSYKETLLLQLANDDTTDTKNKKTYSACTGNQDDKASSITNATISDISTIDSNIDSQEEYCQRDHRLPKKLRSKRKKHQFLMEQRPSATGIADSGIFIVVLFNGLHVSVGSCLRNRQSQIIFPDVY
jgi:hypothetical protein